MEQSLFYLNIILESYQKLSAFIEKLPNKMPSDNGIEGLTEATRGEIETIKKQLNFQAIIPQCYNYSILEGEYYREGVIDALQKIDKAHENLSKVIDTVLNQINAATNQASSNSEEIAGLSSPSNNQSQNFTFYVEEYLSEIKNIITNYPQFSLHYKQFFKKISNRLGKNSGKEFLDPEFDQRFETLKWKASDVSKRNKPITIAPEQSEIFFNLFVLSIQVAKYDEGYAGYICERKAILSLIEIDRIIRQLQHYNLITKDILIVDCIEEKCRLLIIKIYTRLRKEAIEYDVVSLGIGNLEYNIEHLLSKFTFLKPIAEKAISHYNNFETDCDLDENGPFQRRNLLQFKKIDDLDIAAIHKTCKYIRLNKEQIVNDSSEWNYYDTNKFLTELAKKIEHLKSNTHSSEEVALESCYYLITNTQFHLEVELFFKRKTTFAALLNGTTEIKEKYEELTRKHTLDLPPLFLYKIFCSFLARLYRRLASFIENAEEKIIPTEEQVEKLTGFFIEYYKADVKYLQALNQCKNKGVLPLYLNTFQCAHLIKESKSYTDWVNFQTTLANINPERNSSKDVLTIFLDSSYICPANYEHLEYDHLTEKNEVQNEIALITNILTIAPLRTYKDLMSQTFKEYTNLNEKKLDEKIKESQYNAVQMIGLYAGIIVFMLGSAVAITKLPYTEVIFLFLLVFAGAISLFVLLLRLIFLPGRIKQFKSTITDQGTVLDEEKWNTPVILYNIFFLLLCVSLIWYSSDQINKYNLHRITSQRFSYQLRLDSVHHAQELMKYDSTYRRNQQQYISDSIYLGNESSEIQNYLDSLDHKYDLQSLNNTF